MVILAGKEEPKDDPVIPEILEGESLQYNYPIAYPTMSENSIQLVSITNSEGTYGMYRPEAGKPLELYYLDSDGKTHVYYPEIFLDDSSMNYEDIYAIEKDDGYGIIPKLTYLCMALQTPYFDERIALSDKEEIRNSQLKAYGLTEDKIYTLFFSYTESVKGEDGKTAEVTKTHTIKVGHKDLTEKGYYFMVDDRDFVYASRTSYYDYAIAGFASFVKSTLVAEGLDKDSGYGPYLTTGYYQWLNEQYKEKGAAVAEDSRVIAFTDIITVTEKGEYSHTGYDSIEIDLLKYGKDPAYKRLVDAIVGKAIGKYGTADTATLHNGNIIITVPLDFSANRVIAADKKTLVSCECRITAIEAVVTSEGEKTDEGYEVGKNNVIKISYTYSAEGGAEKTATSTVDLSKAELDEEVIKKLRAQKVGALTESIAFTVEYEKVNYDYRINSIEAIITENGEIVDTGYTVGDNNLIKIGYSYSVEGGDVKSSYAVLDLSDELLDADTVSKLRAQKVGALTESIDFSVGYHDWNSKRREGKYIITDILEIFDKDGNVAEKVAEDSLVKYRYRFEVNGEVIYEDEFPLNLSKAESEFDKKFKTALVGKKVSSGLEISVDSYVARFELLKDFKTYSIAEIEYFVTQELQVAFRFQNNSERDPYYGESLYENLMENEYSLYGLSLESCQAVARLLGGVAANNESVTAGGYSGTETVAIGLSPEVLDKYGLYAHTIYFELPRDIEGYVPDSEADKDSIDRIDDFRYKSIIGFTLYISDPDPIDGTRFVASDKYDIVAKVKGDDFSFLDEKFESFWARRSIILLDSNKIDFLEVEFLLADLVGKYTFDLNIESDEGMEVKVTPEGECTPNALTEFIKANGLEYLSLEELYDKTYPDDPEKGKYEPDSVGTTYFREAIRLIYVTDFQGLMPEEDKADFLKPENMLMRLRLKVDGYPSRYVFEFYRGDDRRVLVSIHKENANGVIRVGPVSDFYISTFAFKKMVWGLSGVLNAEKIDPDIGYPDDLK